MNTCSKCSPGHGFEVVEGQTNCILKDQASCTISEDVSPFKCLLCDAGYFISEGVCVLANIEIANCLINDTADTCSQCQAGYILAADRLSCFEDIQLLSTMDGSCSSVKIEIEPKCSFCRPGYLFSDSSCISCSNNTHSQGCFQCNYLDQSECLICKSGYYMNKDTTCVKIPLTSTNATNATNSTSGEAGMNLMVVVLYFLITIW